MISLAKRKAGTWGMEQGETMGEVLLGREEKSMDLIGGEEVAMVDTRIFLVVELMTARRRTKVIEVPVVDIMVLMRVTGMGSDIAERELAYLRAWVGGRMAYEWAIYVLPDRTQRRRFRCVWNSCRSFGLDRWCIYCVVLERNPRQGEKLFMIE